MSAPVNPVTSTNVSSPNMIQDELLTEESNAVGQGLKTAAAAIETDLENNLQTFTMGGTGGGATGLNGIGQFAGGVDVPVSALDPQATAVSALQSPINMMAQNQQQSPF